MQSQYSQEEIQTILTSPPFVQVEGVINIRDVGGYASTTSPGLHVKTGLVYRSGEPTRITEAGKKALKGMKVEKVFDMRSATEIVAYDSATLGLDGVEIVQVPLSEKEAYDPVSLQSRVKSFETDEAETFKRLYAEMLEIGGNSFEPILKFLRDNPDASCLVHCTAGKDRTGIFTALLLLLLGVSDDDITKDYSLTTIGLQPILPMLIARFQKQQVFKDNWQGTLNMGKSEPKTMRAILQMIREKYGGAEGYLEGHTNLRQEDFEKIRKNMLVEDDI